MVHTDSDWAGCTRTRRSTSGGSIQLGQHSLRTWSTTQRTVAMSSAEAEYNSLIEGVQRSLGVQTMLAELGVVVKIIVYTDSSAAKSFASQRGLGRMRHMEVRKLWLQEEVRQGRVRLAKVRGDANPADLLTKYLGPREVDDRCASLHIEVVKNLKHELASVSAMRVETEGGCQESDPCTQCVCFTRPCNC